MVEKQIEMMIITVARLERRWMQSRCRCVTFHTKEDRAVLLRSLSHINGRCGSTLW